MENIINIDANNQGSFLGPLASKYSYKPELRAILDRLYQAAKHSANRAFVLEGEVIRAAQTTEESAKQYMQDGRVLVIVELPTIEDHDTTCNRLCRKLDELKADGQGGQHASEEYMSVLKELQTATKARLAATGLRQAAL